MNHERVCIEEMVWIPGQGPDEKTVRDLAGRFHKPSEPLGEAWFMGETRLMYDDLNAGGIEATSNASLDKYLNELPSAIWCFPRVRQWEAWYAYLTPRVLLAGRFLDGEEPPVDISHLWDGLIALSVVTAHNSPENGVLTYEADFAHVLVPLIMHPQFWRGGQFNPRQKTAHLAWSDGLEHRFPTSMLLAWRYLAPKAIHPWLCSVLAIESGLWCFQFLVWLRQIEPIFRHQSSAYEVLKECDIESIWSDSSTWLICMKEPNWESYPPHRVVDARASLAQERSWELIPPRNIAALREAIVQEFDEESCVEWMQYFAEKRPKWPNEKLAGLPQVLAELRS